MLEPPALAPKLSFNVRLLAEQICGENAILLIVGGPFVSIKGGYVNPQSTVNEGASIKRVNVRIRSRMARDW